ncbi:AfsR/SARP family transcriptional regulator [Actinophytocola algeriensis]|uniref:DNA-binding SARP family transcriptional activator n=1 Tax=Actinophytocola algeriensis TaxID=1768010 RepID=A0A7W7VFI5_9PSEU|nr:BTAD domain-containing putative transcriptional regulator [Actinophytocola algeriensis]MBB4908367.1 DNA-binding SARP family transcriptional activator [Actinophytocola algeriensis]
MRFGVLGPVEVWQGGRALPVGSARERFVLASLLLNAGRLTHVDQLVDALWAAPPRSARSQLHNMISNLRKRLRTEGGLIEFRTTGYQLNLGPHEFDLLEFRRLATTGRAAADRGEHDTAVRLFTGAMALWRGPALADMADELLGDARRALHAEQLAIAEAALDADLVLGRFDDVLRSVAPLIDEHPYRESLHEKRMRALLATGRRADALEHYRRTYRSFADELGVEPGAALRDLEQRILRGDRFTGATPASPVPRQLPPSGALTGRDDLLGELVTTVRSGDVSPAVLVGPGGVGKTALAVAAGHRLADDFPDGQLYANLAGSQGGGVEPHAVIGRFLRAAGVLDTALPDDREERVALYRSHFAARRVLLVLDDAGSEDQVRPLLLAAAGCRTVVTSRHQLGALVTSARWRVPVLAEDDAVRLLAATAGPARVDAEPGTAGEIARLCGGLPLAVSIAAARLAARPHWTLDELRERLDHEHGRLDELSIGDLDVRASIALSHAALTPPLRLLFRRLGLLTAPSWPAWVVEPLTGAPAARLLEQLVDAHLVEQLGKDDAGQHRYRLHDLVAAFAAERARAEDTAADRDGALERVVHAWAALAATADERIPHDWARAPERSRVVAPPAAAALARHSPTAWFEAERHSLIAAVATAAALGHTELVGMLALHTCGFLELRSYRDDADYVLATAIRHARAAGDRELLVRLLGALFIACLRRDRHAPLAALAEEQLALARALGDPEEEALALLNAGRAANRHSDFAAAIEWLERAAACASRPGVAASLSRSAKSALAANLVYLGRPHEAMPLFRTALRLSEEQQDVIVAALNRYHLGGCLTRAGLPEEAEAVLTPALEVSLRYGEDTLWAYVQQVLADVDMRRGRLGSAAQRLERSRETHQRIGEGDGYAEALRSTGDLAALRGDWAAAIEWLTSAAEIWRRIGSTFEVAATLARLGAAHLATGDAGQAAACRGEATELLGEMRLGEASLYLPPWYGSGGISA